MARVKANSAENYEGMLVIINPDEYPIAYRNKIEELVEQGAYPTIQDAEKDNPYFEIEVEFYYDKHSGLYAVESGAIESSAEALCSPYSGEPMIDYVED